MNNDTAQQPSNLNWFETHNWKVLFAAIWSGQAFSLLGSSLVQFALVWWLTEKTGSATVLATASLAALLPQVVFSPFAGALVDRWNRRLIMIVADSGIALVTLGLIGLFAADMAQVWHIYVIMMIRSVGGAFHWPAMQASSSLMVPKQHLSRVAGFNQTLQGGIGIIAPPLGALLIEALPMQTVLSIDVITAAIAVSPLLLIAIPQPERSTAPDGKPTSVLGDVREGLRYVRGWPGLLMILLMATGINFLFTPAFSLLPLVITEHFDGGALELGWIQTAWGVGVVLGGLTLGVWGGFKNNIYTSMLGLLGMGAGVIVLGLSPASAFVFGLVGMFMAGFMNPITNGPLFAMLQSSVVPDMQGRVFTLVNASAMAMSPLSLAVAGPVADLVGIRFWYVVAGMFCMLMGVTGCFLPAIVNVEKQGQQRMADYKAQNGYAVEHDPIESDPVATPDPVPPTGAVVAGEA
ncbi:MAG: MFS transporter [Anaerolineae bacterium]|nr:MFS transporter [Anaerolineae bacterium]